MKKLSQKVFGRIAVTAVLILLQAAWLLVWFTRLASYAPWVSAVFTVLSILIVLYIVRKDDNPAYKIVWLILILLVPLLGGLLYVVFGNKRPERRMREKFARAMKATRPLLAQAEAVLGKLPARERATAHYVAACGGYPVWENTEVRYYPIGEEMYAAMMEEMEQAQHYIFLEYFIIRQYSGMWQNILALLERKVRTMATTHYSELKAFALSTPGVENASVEFDVESLRPTYRLSIGIPGKSNAFDISRKLGLPERLIDGAKELLSKEDIRFEDVIANAEYHRQIAEREREIAEETRRETVKLRDEAERLRREIEQSRDKSLKKAKDEARRVLENARREADGIIRELKAMKKQAQTPEHEVQRLKKRMEDGIDALSEGLSEKSSVNFTPPKSVRPGDTVEIVHLGTKGTVLSPADRNGEVQIQAGIIKMKAHISQLRLVEPDKPKQSRVINRVSAAKPAVPMEVDVRGMTLDEAIAAVDIYLADATLAGLNEVSIIHGKGTGVLRTGIQRHLRTHMNVRKYRDGMYGEGEQGVTVVTLK